MHKHVKTVNKFEHRAFLFGVLLLVGLGTLGFVGLAHAQQIGPNPTVQIVDNPNVSCESPVPSVEETGQFGQSITVSAEDPIDFVVVKSAPGGMVDSTFDTDTSGQITSSGNILGYVVFTCPASSTTDTTTPTTDTTTTTEAPTSTT